VVDRNALDRLSEPVPVKDTGVLAPSGEQTRSAATALPVQEGREHGIGCLSTATGKNNVLGLGAGEPRHLFAGRLQGGPGSAAFRVDR
jgi:hypothetical protein